MKANTHPVLLAPHSIEEPIDGGKARHDVAQFAADALEQGALLAEAASHGLRRPYHLVQLHI